MPVLAVATLGVSAIAAATCGPNLDSPILISCVAHRPMESRPCPSKPSTADEPTTDGSCGHCHGLVATRCGFGELMGDSLRRSPLVRPLRESLQHRQIQPESDSSQKSHAVQVAFCSR